MTKIKSTFSFLYEQFYHFLLYITRHPVMACIMLGWIILSYGPYAFATDYYVDSEVIINIPGTNYNWLEIGRFGLVLVRGLLGTSWYNPYYTGILLLLFLWLTGMTLSYVAGKLFPRISPALCTLGSLIFLTYPTFTEQYYFHFQSAEISFGLWLSILSLGLFYLFVRDGRLSAFALTLPVYVITFSIYQAFIPLTLCGYLVIFLCFITRFDIESGLIRRSIVGSILHFAAAFLISQGINKFCFPSSGYLNDQIIWTGAASLKESFRAVLSASFRMLTGQGLFYTTLLLFAILATVAAWITLSRLPLWQFMLGTLSCVGIALTPFMMTFLMGEDTANRSQFTYGLAAVLLLYFCIQTFMERSLVHETASDEISSTETTTPGTGFPGKLHLASLGFFLGIALFQLFTVRFIWSAHEYVTRYDRQTATHIMETMYDSFIVDSQVGTILWGYLQPDSPYDRYTAGSPSYLFTSVFNLEYDTEPYCYFSTVRALGYMESMGHKFTLPTHRTQNVSDYTMRNNQLATFPNPGCFFNDVEAFTLNLGGFPE